MKQSFKSKVIIRYPEEDIRKQLSEKQLTALGLVAFTYNYAEAAINRMVGAALRIPVGLQAEVSTRINGIDGRIET